MRGVIFILFSLAAKLADGATLFSIDGNTFSGSWDTADEATNTVTITFDEQGQSESSFNVEISDCSDADFSVTSGGGTKSSSADVEVTFTNQNAITSAVACLDVALYVNGISIAVATRRVEYSVTAESGTSGTGSVTITQSNLDGVATNSQSKQTNAESGGHSLVFVPSIVTSGPIQYGDTFDVEIAAISGYDVDISAISIGTITDEKNGAGYVSAPDNKSITIKLPLNSFLDASGGSETITLTVDWKLTGTRRQLRGESAQVSFVTGNHIEATDEDGYDRQGKSLTEMVVKVVPLSKLDGVERAEQQSNSIADEGEYSSGYRLTFTSATVAITTIAGAILV
ncbi:hypothetical protein IV203_024306 [Nitzschia inconspicua]|uniref:Uncharacterized protein n=1 Tax=Nitzschia inconspicua TaxID=303405 RepID=A0A9K3KC18_9STRA|nr:hypothetical protein IV203_024306 [Nitzschia inconspicua]